MLMKLFVTSYAAFAKHSRVIALSVAQLLVLAFILFELDVLTSGYRRLFYLAILAFVPFQFVATRHKMPLFALFSVFGLVVVLGGSPDKWWDASQGMIRTLPIIVAAAVLAGTVLLPVGFWTRAALLAACGVGIASLRASYFGPESLAIAWPVLASLVMFRVVLLFYAVAAEKKRPTLSQIAAYLLMFPSVANSIFPLVDFSVFSRPTMPEERWNLIGAGVRRIRRGIGQLIVYRLVHGLIALPPALVADGTDVAAFILASTFAYLQVSGLFHLATGLLLLFGFNLPETNQRYFLASSFTDYWRRVNIYWKDFILKVFYYPTYFRFKGHGATFALVVATLWSFLVTWALHLYQTWWLKGTATVTGPDAAFWGILGLLVLGNSLWEVRRGRVRKRLDGRYATEDTAGVLLRTGATFLCIALLWSLWNTQTFDEWWGIMRLADWRTVVWLAVAAAGVMASAYVLEAQPRILQTLATRVSIAPRPTFAAAAGIVPLLLVVGLSTPRVQKQLDNPGTQPFFDVLNLGDSLRGLLEVGGGGGYYERLNAVDAANRQLWESLLRQRLPSQSYGGSWPVRSVGDLRTMEALPNVRVEAFDTVFETNDHGLRDRNYSLAKPSDTLRFAVLGSSHTAGWGVAAEEVFASVIERRLNQKPPSFAGATSFEVLNFAFPAMSPLRQMDEWEHRAGRFDADVALFIAHPNDADWLVQQVAALPKEGRRSSLPFIDDALRQARVTRRTPSRFAEKRLHQFERDLLFSTYRTLVEKIIRTGSIPVAVMIPLPKALPIDHQQWMEQQAVLTQAGFAIIDLQQVFNDYEPESLSLDGDPDMHLNSLGHRLVADALEARLRSLTEVERIVKASAVERVRSRKPDATGFGPHANAQHDPTSPLEATPFGLPSRRDMRSHATGTESTSTPTSGDL